MFGVGSFLLQDCSVLIKPMKRIMRIDPPILPKLCVQIIVMESILYQRTSIFKQVFYGGDHSYLLLVTSIHISISYTELALVSLPDLANFRR